MKIYNKDIRLSAKVHNVRLWQVAEALGISPGTFSIRLRHELGPVEKDTVLKIIKNIAKEE